MKLRILIAAALLLLVMAFVIQNSALVPVTLLFWEVEVPRSALIFSMLLIGVVLGWVVRAMIAISKAIE